MPAEMFEALGALACGGVLELDADLEITRANPWWSQWGGAFSGDLPGRSLDELVAAEGSWVEALRELECTPPRNPVMFECQLVTGGCASAWVEMTFRRIRTTADTAGFLVLARDITAERRRREEADLALERARELNLIKSTFVTMVSHEFRNPLTAIVCATEVLQLLGEMKGADTKESAEYLGAILRASERMTRLMDELLLLGRIESGALRFSPRELSPVEMCESLRREIEPAERQARVVIETGLTQGETELLDPFLIRHTLLNVMTNALKYSPASDPVTLRLIRDGEHLRFEVEDRGIGIPPKDHERMFRAFSRASNVGAIQGTGVGLSIARECARLHQGDLTFVSPPGRGTTFTLRVPCGGARRTGA